MTFLSSDRLYPYADARDDFGRMHLQSPATSSSRLFAVQTINGFAVRRRRLAGTRSWLCAERVVGSAREDTERGGERREDAFYSDLERLGIVQNANAQPSRSIQRWLQETVENAEGADSDSAVCSAGASGGRRRRGVAPVSLHFSLSDCTAV